MLSPPWPQFPRKLSTFHTTRCTRVVALRVHPKLAMNATWIIIISIITKMPCRIATPTLEQLTAKYALNIDQADDAHTHSVSRLNATCIFFGLPLGLGHMPAGSAAKIYWINLLLFCTKFLRNSLISLSLYIGSQ